MNYKEKMKHLFIVTLFSILHLNYGFKAFQNMTGIEKAKYDIAKLLEIQHVFKRRIKRQAQVKLDYPLTNNHHRPKNPQFKKLMKQMNNIIPARIVNPDFIQSTQNILKDLRSEKLNDVQLNLKLDDLESILNDEDIGSNSGSLRTALITRKLSELFAHLESIHGRPNGQMDPWSLAPFAKLGEDCFSDVNHKQFTWEIKKLALVMQDFIEYRVMNNQNGAQYKMDEMMVNLIQMVFQLHRATLRNWNHILMVVSNFAYMQNGNHKKFAKFFSSNQSSEMHKSAKPIVF